MKNTKDLLMADFMFFLLTYIPYSLIFPYSLLNDQALGAKTGFNGAFKLWAI